MIAICERTSIEITLENATNYAVYALLRLFSIIDLKRPYLNVCVPFYMVSDCCKKNDISYINLKLNVLLYPFFFSFERKVYFLVPKLVCRPSV